MKRAAAILGILAVLLTFNACRKEIETPEEIARPSELVESEQEELVTYWETEETLDMGEAQEIIKTNDADVTTPEYRKAVYTVNETTAESIIEKAAETQMQTDDVKELFEGIAFRFLEGEGFSSETVKKQLIKKGTYSYSEEDGYYHFTFYDRTLAQAAAGVKSDHCLQEYTAVLEWLLSDPNVEVKALLD